MKDGYRNCSRWRRVALVVPLCTASALGACAARPSVKPPPAAAAAHASTASASNDVQCHLEKLTGSLVATRVCTTAAQREKIRQSVQDARDSMNKALVPPDCPTGACH